MPLTKIIHSYIHSSAVKKKCSECSQFDIWHCSNNSADPKAVFDNDWMLEAREGKGRRRNKFNRRTKTHWIRWMVKGTISFLFKQVLRGRFAAKNHRPWCSEGGFSDVYLNSLARGCPMYHVNTIFKFIVYWDICLRLHYIFFMYISSFGGTYLWDCDLRACFSPVRIVIFIRFITVL